MDIEEATEKATTPWLQNTGYGTPSGLPRQATGRVVLEARFISSEKKKK